MFRRSVALILACLAATTAPAQTLEPAGRATLDVQVANGLSGLEVSEDGTAFTAVGDIGWLFRGTFLRDGGDLTGVTLASVDPILGQDGLPVTARRVGDWSDAEGLAIAEDGRAWISFERWSRVANYDALDAAAGYIPDHPEFRDQPDNRQLEAVAVDQGGVVWALPETVEGGRAALYRLDGDTWTRAGQVPMPDGFAVVGADFAPDGKLWLLERGHWLGRFFRSRISVIDPEAPDAKTILWTSARSAFGNLEGLSLWQDADGLRVMLVSDNNREMGNATEFVEFRVTSQ